jgi:hypothetical protein
MTIAQNLKKTFTLWAVSLIGLVAYGADAVTMHISDGLDNAALKTKMEQTISKILTEANAAHEERREMHYSALGIPTSVQGALAALWDNSPFICLDTEIVEHCLTTGTGYQVRNIPLMLQPLLPGDIAEDEDYQEAVVSFDKQGNLVSFYLAISMNLYMNVVKDNKEITDLRRRQLILDYVEQFRTAYNQKDTAFLQAIFSDDALIITGKVIERKPMDGIQLPDKIEYKKQSKKEYLGRLAKVFDRNKQIRVTFDEIEVMRHPANVDFYGVTLHQGYSSDNYHDDGYLFLLWDFRNEAHPQIHVRTWQPDSYNVDGTGKQRIPKDEIFSLSDFDI